MLNKEFEIDLAGLAVEDRNALRAPEANEMLERTPGWLMRWGLLSMVLVLGILVLIAVLVKYPDTLEGRATITTVPAPARVHAVSGGRIARLFVHDGAMVAKNDLLAELENSIGHVVILKLEDRLKKISRELQSSDDHALSALITPSAEDLGSMQLSYENLLGLIRKKISWQQKKISGEQGQERKDDLTLEIRKSIQELNKDIQTWKELYVLAATTSGKVDYTKPLQLHELVRAGEELCVVLPDQQKYMAAVTLPAEGIGKIKAGQRVHLLLDNFPYNEFGWVEGTVIKKNAMPEAPASTELRQRAIYKVYVQLPDVLITSFHDTLPLSSEMTATARIITKDRNLLQRMLANMSKIEN